jgi:predicted metal-dependent hydrolase
MESSMAKGIHLFNSQKFFEAHEALEAVWLQARGQEKVFLHGLIQVAAAFHHFTRGNLTGFRSLLEKGLTKLEKRGNSHSDIEIEDFLEQLQPWRELTQQSAGQKDSSGPRETSPSTWAPFPHILPASAR